MAGEVDLARQLVEQAMGHAEFDKDSMGRALINAVIEQYRQYRTADDIASELRFIIDNLDEDEFVITRGC
ncbi:MAG: hypothetical protein WDZ30_13115 [Cellvibrionaceae bacterium]